MIGSDLIFQNGATRGTIWIATGEAAIKKSYFSVTTHYRHLKDKGFFDWKILENSILYDPYFAEFWSLIL